MFVLSKKVTLKKKLKNQTSKPSLDAMDRSDNRNGDVLQFITSNCIYW